MHATVCCMHCVCTVYACLFHACSWSQYFANNSKKRSIFCASGSHIWKEEKILHQIGLLSIFCQGGAPFPIALHSVGKSTHWKRHIQFKTFTTVKIIVCAVFDVEFATFWKKKLGSYVKSSGSYSKTSAASLRIFWARFFGRFLRFFDHISSYRRFWRGILRDRECPTI